MKECDIEEAVATVLSYAEGRHKNKVLESEADFFAGAMAMMAGLSIPLHTGWTMSIVSGRSIITEGGLITPGPHFKAEWEKNDEDRKAEREREPYFRYLVLNSAKEPVYFLTNPDDASTEAERINGFMVAVPTRRL